MQICMKACVMQAREKPFYQFDVEAGLYNVYVGMFDPAGWYGSHKGKRYADISVNNQVVTDEYQYLNNTKDTLAYQNIAVGEDGKLTVAVAPGQNSSEAIQVSFIAVSRKGEAEKNRWKRSSEMFLG